MKANRLARLLLLLFVNAAIAQLPGQQSEADRKLFEHIKAAAEKGDPMGQIRLGCAYYLGEDGASKDYAKAVFWFRKAANNHGNVAVQVDAQLHLGQCYSIGAGVAEDYTEAANGIVGPQNREKLTPNIALDNVISAVPA